MFQMKVSKLNEINSVCCVEPMRCQVVYKIDIGLSSFQLEAYVGVIFY
jgi:hypothetical protein